MSLRRELVWVRLIDVGIGRTCVDAKLSMSGAHPEELGQVTGMLMRTAREIAAQIRAGLVANGDAAAVDEFDRAHRAGMREPDEESIRAAVRPAEGESGAGL